SEDLASRSPSIQLRDRLTPLVNEFTEGLDAWSEQLKCWPDLQQHRAEIETCFLQLLRDLKQLGLESGKSEDRENLRAALGCVSSRLAFVRDKLLILERLRINAERAARQTLTLSEVIWIA